MEVLRRPEVLVRWLQRLGAAAGLGIALSLGGGCTLLAVMAAGAEREGSHTVPAEYTGLANKSFAVLVSAPPVIQANAPATPPKVIIDLSVKLAETVGATGFVPPARIIEFQNNRPNWVARPLGEIGQEMGVQRIVYVDIEEYRLQDPGNEYLWQGVASAMVAVIEVDSVTPDEFAYSKQITVKFPDQDGYGPNELQAALVNTELTNRLIQRIAWLFVTHEEPNKLTY